MQKIQDTHKVAETWLSCHHHRWLAPAIENLIFQHTPSVRRTVERTIKN
jgi:hypothetical protein